MQLIVAESVAEQVRAQIAERGLPVECAVAYDDGRIDGDVGQATAYLRAFQGGAAYANVLAAAPQLRWVHTASAGVDGLGLDELKRRDITLTNSAGVHAIPIAEWVMFALLLAVKQGRELLAAQQQRRWADFEHAELGGKTLLIFGAGGIGQEIAKRAAAFGMRIWGVNRSGRAVPGVECVVKMADWRALLPDADFLVIAAPHTPETHHAVDAAALAQLPPHAWLVNVARGGLVDEPALIDALAAGRIAGAALDTFEQEPLPAESPLWSLPNVVVSPHSSGHSPRSMERVLARFWENLDRFLAGDELASVVDPDAGY